MSSVIIVHPSLDKYWPWAGDRFHELWKAQGSVEFIRLAPGDERELGEIVPNPSKVTRLISLGVTVTSECLNRFVGLKEAAITTTGYGKEPLPDNLKNLLLERGVKVYSHLTKGFWGQSVAEFGLALTLCGLRRIPQTHHDIITSLKPWDYEPANGIGVPSSRGLQFGDDSRFANGTVEGKRIRIVGAGNIASRYAKFVSMMGADVAAWDPFAADPSFHLAGTRKEWHLSELVKDAEIFVPMVPLTAQTRGMIQEEHIRALPKGCLVVLATRANICDMNVIRERVLADEISLAADVFDIEPLQLDDPLLGRHNVIHTPHNGGRTIQANERWAEMIVEQFLPVNVG